MHISYQCTEAASKARRVLGMVRWKYNEWDKESFIRVLSVLTQNVPSGLVTSFAQDIDCLERVQRRATKMVKGFYSAPQCSHCKRCISYRNSVCPSVRPSVRLSIRLSIRLSVRLSVTRRYCVKTTAHSLHCWIAKCVQFCRNQKIFPRDDRFSLKFWLQVTYPLLKAASFDTFCLVAPQP